VNKDEVGRTGECLAAEYLGQLGYEILVRNWRDASGQRRVSGERYNRGELDIVALDGKTLVGVEVKTRSTEAYGHPAIALTPQKVARLRRLLGHWISAQRLTGPHFRDIRVDAVAIVLNPTGSGGPEVTHYRGIS